MIKIYVNIYVNLVSRKETFVNAFQKEKGFKAYDLQHNNLRGFSREYITDTEIRVPLYYGYLYGLL